MTADAVFPKNSTVSPIEGLPLELTLTVVRIFSLSAPPVLKGLFTESTPTKLFTVVPLSPSSCATFAAATVP